jgi:putative transposase
LIAEACARRSKRVLAYTLMPNHFHLVLFPQDDGDLSRWMQWLSTAHVRRHHRQYGTSGHVWQGRFKAFPIQRDEHLLTVMAYVERNPLRAGLVQRAEDWPWSSLRLWMSKTRPAFFSDGPVDRPRGWLREVNRLESDTQLAVLRRCLHRGALFGKPTWMAACLCLCR